MIKEFLTEIGLPAESFVVVADMPGGGSLSVFTRGTADQKEHSRSQIEKAIAGLRELNGEFDDATETYECGVF